ncbi:MAG: hypothetical protein K8S62_14585 [Candidatus Sabulitectum sp.]|nr:hypothetical protein [Candidatus Sabulitectum sp.]
MRYVFFVLAFAALAFAANDGCTDTSVGLNPPSGNDGVAFSVINDWTLANKALGIDVFEGPGFYVLGADNVNDWIQAFDATTGVPAGSLPLSAANGSCFGVAWNNDPDTDTYYTDDWASSNLFYTEDFGVSWTTEPNPAGNNARGMDFDGTDYWTTNGTGGGIWRFLPGTGAENIATPEIPSQPSGLTVFPYGSNLGIAITTYNTHNIYFYQWNGSTLDFMASAACPVSGIDASYGLAYAATNGHMYWSYRTGTAYHIAELTFTITSLERTSWGSIKNSF